MVGGHCWIDFLIAIVKLLVLMPHSTFLIIATAFISFGEHLGVPDLYQRACQFYKIYSRLNLRRASVSLIDSRKSLKQATASPYRPPPMPPSDSLFMLFLSGFLVPLGDMRAAVIMWSSLALLPSLMRPCQLLRHFTYLLQKVLSEIPGGRPGFLLHVPSRWLKFL